MGILIGFKVPVNRKKVTAIISDGVFGVTYAVSMTKVFKILKYLNQRNGGE